MRINSIIAAGAAAALFMTPAAALAGGPNIDHPGQGQAKREARAEARAEAMANAEAPTEAKANAQAEARTEAKADGTAVPPSRAKAYGKLCQDQSKKHVEGQKGTPFSRCVRAMAHLASGKAKTPKAACKGLSKKHVKGKKGTAFSRCVKAGRKLEDDLDRRYGGEEYDDPFGEDS
jgi:hypothetical protein